MFDKIILLVVLLITIGLYVWRQIVFDRRESDLLTRLMSKNVGEYAAASKQLGRIATPITVQDAVDKLTEEGISADEAALSQLESDHVRIS